MARSPCYFSPAAEHDSQDIMEQCRKRVKGLSLLLLMAWKVAGHYGLDRILLSSMMKRLHHPTGNKASRMWRPIVTPEPRAPALSIDKTHGFELPVDDC